MTGNKKKTPASTSGKHVTASAWARTSVKKVKINNSDLSGSYIRAPKKAVATFSTNEALSTDPQPDSNGQILAYLKKIDNSNQELMKRVENLESRSISSTSRSSKCNPNDALELHGRHTAISCDALAGFSQPAAGLSQASNLIRGMPTTQPTIGTTGVSLHDPVSGTGHRDAILPGLDTSMVNRQISMGNFHARS